MKDYSLIRLFIFWSRGWEKYIIIHWPKGIDHSCFFKEVRASLGVDFRYEKYLGDKQPTLEATKKGLKDYGKTM